MEKIGEGSLAEVFKVLKADEKGFFSRVFALKVPKDRTHFQDLRSELEALFRVRSEYCNAVYGWEIFKGRPALLLEYIDGISLQALACVAPLTLSETEWIRQSVTQGLRDLHGVGLVHGDLTPRNILIDRTGSVKLVDFGLSLGCSGAWIGTPRYFSPQRIQTGEPSPTDDAFALEQILSQLGGDPNSAGADCIRIGTGPRESLGQKAETALKKLKMTGTETALTPVRSSSSNSGVRLWSLFVPLVSLLFAVEPQRPSEVGHEVLKEIRVSLRSHRWQRVTLNGRSLGYTPLDLHLPRGNYRLQLQGPDRSRLLHLNLGQDGDLHIRNGKIVSRR